MGFPLKSICYTDFTPKCGPCLATGPQISFVQVFNYVFFLSAWICCTRMLGSFLVLCGGRSLRICCRWIACDFLLSGMQVCLLCKMSKQDIDMGKLDCNLYPQDSVTSRCNCAQLAWQSCSFILSLAGSVAILPLICLGIYSGALKEGHQSKDSLTRAVERDLAFQVVASSKICCIQIPNAWTVSNETERVTIT